MPKKKTNSAGIAKATKVAPTTRKKPKQKKQNLNKIRYTHLNFSVLLNNAGCYTFYVRVNDFLLVQ